MKKQSKLFNVAITGAVMASSAAVLAPVNVEAASPFKDLSSKDMFYAPIMNLVERGILTGYPDKSIKAGQPVTRAEAAIIIARVLELDTKNVEDPGFKDVPKTSGHYGAIAALENSGIINGVNKDRFGVNTPLTRGQMAVILTKAFELKGQATDLPFKDVKNHPFKNSISTIYVNNITAGTTANTFGVNKPVTRGQLASFIVRAEAVNNTNNLAQNTKQDATTLVNTLLDAFKPTVNNFGELALGTPTVKNANQDVVTSGKATTFNFNDDQVDVKFVDIKNSIDTAKLKDEVIKEVAPIILDLPSTKINHIDSIYIGDEKINTQNISSSNYIDQLTAALSKDVISSTLESLTGLDVASASGLTVAKYFKENKTNQSTIKITFDDNSSLEYAITIVQ